MLKKTIHLIMLLMLIAFSGIGCSSSGGGDGDSNGNATTWYEDSDGDGYNDYWLIQGFEGDVEVFIFNGSGNIVFESKAYENNWDGTYKGNKLPPGVYYYLIKTESLVFSEDSVRAALNSTPTWCFLIRTNSRVYLCMGNSY